MTITCTGNDAEGHSYHFGMPPTDWKLPKGYMIKMARYPGQFAEIVSNSWVEPWTGKGLPPAGTKCEVLNRAFENAEWEMCTVLFLGKHRILYDSESCYERVGNIEDLKFRTIRTPEQIEEDERDKAAADMHKLFYSANDTGKEAMFRLYDAGYRKQAPQ